MFNVFKKEQMYYVYINEETAELGIMQTRHPWFMTIICSDGKRVRCLGEL